jgi:hypothetical protein
MSGPVNATSLDAQQDVPTAEALAGELSQIRAYVDATNSHINYLETIAEETAEEQIGEIKRGLRDAHRGLERLEGRFAAVGEIKRQVWQIYRRLREFEEDMREGEDMSVRPVRTSSVRTTTGPRGIVRAPPAVRTESVINVPGQEVFEAGAIRVIQSQAPEGSERQTEVAQTGEGTWYLTPSTKSPRSRSKTPVSSNRDSWHDTMVVAPRRRPLMVPARARRRPLSVGDSILSTPEPLTGPDRCSFPEELARTRKEVIENVAREENRGGVGINEPRREREGSADGSLISQAVMTANPDPRICVPHLAYIKIHEVRDLKSWLSRHRYLRRSKRISKTEKLLHLLTLLQVGCRFESVAVLFSRTPREVLSACRQAFEGLLEMHSETMLPGRRASDRYLYPHLWHIVPNYGVLEDDASDGAYCPWKKEDICNVLVTLNLYIGRYRSQGGFALDGDILDWGRYIHVDDDEALFDVPHWIERLQTAPPESAAQQDTTT